MLATAHKILIGSAIALCALYGAWAAWRFAGTGEDVYVYIAAGCVPAAVALALYLRYFIRRTARSQPP